MIDDKIGYGYDDLCIIPSTITNIESRSECNPYIDSKQLPLFAAPMCSVVSESNYSTFTNNGIQAIYPRTVKYKNRLKYLKEGLWVALSHQEFKKLFIDDVPTEAFEGKCMKVCIDTANGHIKSLYDDCKVAKIFAKSKGYELTLMVGNIANPDTYRYICDYYNGYIDYVRCSIGTGFGCITSTQTNVHYPIASLIDECRQIANEYAEDTPSIVADGGIRSYANIITALALGADYVMIGSLLASLQESAAETVERKGKIYKRYFGMSTKEAQELINAALEKPLSNKPLVLKTSEGTVKYMDPGVSISHWVSNLTDYMRSTMSYVDAYSLDDLRNKTTLKVMSPIERSAINK